MAGRLSHIAARVVGQPLLIQPSKLDVIAQVLAGRVGLELPETADIDASFDRPEPLASRFVGTRRDGATGKGLPYARTDTGVALITVTGSLVNRGAWIGASSGLTSYEGIAAQVRAAATDPKVTSIVMDIDSPGGEATGAFELADLFRKVGDTKPTTAFVNGLAASAGYLIASGASRIVSVPSGLTGSIGVVVMHADYSRMLDRAGIKPTFIYAGSHKVDANPYEPLSPDVQARLKSEVDAMRESFVQAVAAGRRGKMSAKAARDTEAQVYGGADAKQVGLVDELASFDDLFGELSRRASAAGKTSPATTRRSMTKMDETEPGIAAAIAGERARIQAILTHPSAKGREASAQHLAFETDMTPEAVGSLLQTMAKGSSLAERAQASERLIYGAHVAGADRDSHREIKIDTKAIYAERNKQHRECFGLT